MIKALWPQVREIWIGPEYLGGLRECKHIDRVTGQERWFLSTENAAREAAAQKGIPVYRTVTYGEDR